MRLFTVADLHLSFGVDKPMDIFPGWKDHEKKLLENWQKKISPEDTVVIPGDHSWGMSLEEALPDLEFIDRLNGTKIISKGNHDLWWGTVSKMQRFFDDHGIGSLKILHNNHYAFGDVGICGTRGWVNDNSEAPNAKVIAREAIRLETSIKSALSEGLRPVVFLHYPPVFGTSRNLDMLEVLYKYGIKRVFYGHLHGKAHAFAVNGLSEGINYQLVSCDFLHFDPLDITEIVQNDNLS
ncbi:MAG: metallophosphoesterase [Ruminococcus sp.]|nr:metallophosphoesterase [Ruminococcus sp.]